MQIGTEVMVLETKVAIGDNVRRVCAVIASSAERAGRRPESIRLVAVSKTVSAEKIKCALEAGITCLGENRVQEALEKVSQLSGYRFEFHLIGILQKNKVNKVSAAFDWIETVETIELARKIEQSCERLGKVMSVLVEVNLGREETKSGVFEEELPELLGQMAPFDHLKIRGLMAIPPFFENPEDGRPYFRRLREIAERINHLRMLRVDLQELSMGMSHDYAIAIEEGATIVRVGTAIFGERLKV